MPVSVYVLVRAPACLAVNLCVSAIGNVSPVTSFPLFFFLSFFLCLLLVALALAQVCASGMKAIMMAAQNITLGQRHIMLAGKSNCSAGTKT